MASRRPLVALASQFGTASLRRSSMKTPDFLSTRSCSQVHPVQRHTNKSRIQSHAFSTSAPYLRSPNSSTSNTSSSSSSSSAADPNVAASSKSVKASSQASTPPPPPPPPHDPTIYSYSDISSLASTPDPTRILVDVREPAELRSTGRIPGALNLPITSSPDFMFLSPEEFEDRFGFARPGPDDEVIFYCRAGVRSRAAARLASQAKFGGRVSEYPGSWMDWEKSGGLVERG